MKKLKSKPLTLPNGKLSTIAININKINEIVDWINNETESLKSFPHIPIKNKLVYAKFTNPNDPKQNDFYPVHQIINTSDNKLFVLWCNKMTAVLPIEEFEFRAIETIPFNPFNENSESLEKEGLITKI